MQFCVLNDNLVVKFTDYSTGEPFYSFLGDNNKEKTVAQLMDFISGQGVVPLLRLVPEDCLKDFKQAKFLVKEDPGNFDYIFSIPKLISYNGKKYRGKRNFVNRFLKNYQSYTKRIDISSQDVQLKIKEVFLLWQDEKEVVAPEVENELLALERLLQTADYFPLITIGVFVEDQLIGFSVNEIVDESYAILHFEKADFRSMTGIFPYIMQKTAKELSLNHCKYLNCLQDVGSPGLRRMKKSYYPCRMLKKYIIQPIQKKLSAPKHK